MTQVFLLVIGLLLIGLPLLALAADRVLPAPRRRPPPAPDTRQKLIRKFHLTWQDTLEVEAAVREGRATRPELQPAARGFAEHILAPPTFRGRPITSYSMATRCTWLAVAFLAFLGYAAALGLELGLTYLMVYGTGIAFSVAAHRRRRRAAVAALTANNPSPTPDHHRPHHGVDPHLPDREPRSAPDGASGDRSS